MGRHLSTRETSLEQSFPPEYTRMLGGFVGLPLTTTKLADCTLVLRGCECEALRPLTLDIRRIPHDVMASEAVGNPRSLMVTGDRDLRLSRLCSGGASAVVFSDVLNMEYLRGLWFLFSEGRKAGKGLSSS